MDNKPLEHLAENYIKIELAKAALKYAKPDYDTDGTDLIVLEPINKHYVRQVVVQSKGRNLTHTKSNVKVHKTYVNSNFICFLYIQCDGDSNHYLYIFFHDDFNKWSVLKDDFVLYIPKKFKNDTFLSEARFDSKKHIPRIRELLKSGPIFRQNYVEFEKMALLDILMELWRKFDSLPDENLVVELYNQEEEYCESFLHQLFLSFNYLNCIDRVGSVDHILQLIFNVKNVESPLFELCTVEDINKIRIIRATQAIVYRNLRLGQINVFYDGDSYKGLYFYIGDNEDNAEALLLDNGQYLAYATRSSFLMS